MNFLCEVSQNCVDRYVSTESPGETDAGMQRCDVIIGGTHTAPGARAEGEAWVIQSIKTHSALQSRLYLRPQQSSTSQHWAVFIFQSSSSPGSWPSSIVTAEGRWPPPPRHPRPSDRTLAMDIAKYRQRMETWKTA